MLHSTALLSKKQLKKQNKINKQKLGPEAAAAMANNNDEEEMEDLEECADD